MSERSAHNRKKARAKKLRSRDTPSLEPIKEILRQSNTGERMKKVAAVYLCDSCNQPILKPEDGLVVHGNIYVADPNKRGGLIGNNFPEVKPGEKIEVTDVKENVFCRACFADATTPKLLPGSPIPWNERETRPPVEDRFKTDRRPIPLARHDMGYHDDAHTSDIINTDEDFLRDLERMTVERPDNSEGFIRDLARITDERSRIADERAGNI